MPASSCRIRHVDEQVLDPQALRHVASNGRRPEPFRRVVPARQVRNPGLACEVGLGFGDFAGDVHVGAGGNRILELALGAVGAQRNALHRAVWLGHQGHRATQGGHIVWLATLIVG